MSSVAPEVFLPAFTSYQANRLADILATDTQDSMNWYIPSQFEDPSSTTPYTEEVAGEVTAYFQDWVDRASAAYSATNGRVKLIFPRGTWTIDQITLKSNVHYHFNDVIWKRRSSSTISLLGSMLTVPSRTYTLTLRDPIDNSWVSYQNGGEDPENWYGDGDNMRFSGKLLLDTNNKILSLHVVYLNSVRNLVVEDGALQVTFTGTQSNWWAFAISGRNIVWHRPIVRGGTVVAQDGFHIMGGQNIRVYDGDVESGDDAFVVNSTFVGVYQPDEYISDITVIGGRWISQIGRAFALPAGQDTTSSPQLKPRQMKRISILGAEGKGGQTKNQPIYIGDYSQPDQVYRYTIVSPGSGYTDGYYVCPVPGGNGLAKCHIKIVGGQINRAVVYRDPVTLWQTGANYVGGEAVTLSSIPGGSGGSVINNQQLRNNDMVTDVTLQAKVQYGGENVSDPYGAWLRGCKRLSLDLTMDLIAQSAITPQHRPIVINGAEDCIIKYQQTGVPTNKSAIITSNGIANAGSVNNNLTFKDCIFIGQIEAGGWINITGAATGNVNFENCIWREIQSSCSGIRIADLDQSVQTHVALVRITGGVAYKKSGVTTGSFLYTPNFGGIWGQLTRLEMQGIDLSDMSQTIDAPNFFQQAVLAYLIRSCKGLPSRCSKAVTIAAGGTTATLDISAELRMAFCDTTTLGTGAITLRAINIPAAAGCDKVSIAMTSSTVATLTCNADPTGSGWQFIADVDCTRKPLTIG